MTNLQAYKELTKANVFWDRRSTKEIVVFTEGYKTADCHEIEAFLMQAGMRCTSQSFDKISGKTVSVYKHK